MGWVDTWLVERHHTCGLFEAWEVGVLLRETTAILEVGSHGRRGWVEPQRVTSLAGVPAQSLDLARGILLPSYDVAA